MCSLEKRGNVYVLNFAGDNVDEHRLNPTTFDVIADALNEVERSTDAAALVITNLGKHFSCGIDMKWISEASYECIDLVLEGLEKMLAAFMRLNVPTVAAICGGTVAGAYMLTLAHDYHLMSRHAHPTPSEKTFDHLTSASKLYMCELDLGLPIPGSMMALIRSEFDPQTLCDVVLSAPKVNVEAALEKGIVDGVFEDAGLKRADEVAGRGWQREIYRWFRLATFPGVVEALDTNVP